MVFDRHPRREPVRRTKRPASSQLGSAPVNPKSRKGHLRLRRVTFKYEQGLDRDFYEAAINGEHFKGQAVHADARTGVGVGSVDGTMVSVITSSTSGNIVAVMFGNRGSTMRCNMNYADSSGFTTMGGVGVCEHSEGRVIDIMW